MAVSLNTRLIVAVSAVAGITVVFIATKLFSAQVSSEVLEAAAMLKGEREGALKDGLVLDMKHLFPSRPIDPKKDAGPDFVAELKKIHNLSSSDKTARADLTTLSKGTARDFEIQNLKNFLARAKPHLDRITELSARPRCDFGYDFNKGAELLFPEFAEGKETVKLLCCKVFFESESKNYQAAERSLNASFAFGHLLGQQPTLIAALVGMATNAITGNAIRILCSRYEKDPKYLQMISRVLDNAKKDVDLRRSFDGEVVLGLATIRNLKDFRIEDFLAMSEGNGMKRKSAEIKVEQMIKDAWECRYLQYWRGVYTRLDTKWDDYFEFNRVLKEETEKNLKHKSIDYILNQIIIGSYAQVGLAAIRSTAMWRLMDTKLRLIQYRNSHGKFPDSLAELGSAPIDPFDGKPIRYKNYRNGFMIYSIDRDLVDNGGQKPNSSTPPNGGSDFVVEHP